MELFVSWTCNSHEFPLGWNEVLSFLANLSRFGHEMTIRSDS